VILSVALIIVLGIVADRLFRLIKAPGLLGMILVGVLLGPYGLDLLDGAVLAASADLRLMALIVILLRAGLGLERRALQRAGSVAIKMSALPCLIEGSVVTLSAHLILSLPWLEAAMLGFILAAVSPAVVVPAVIRLKERGLGTAQGIPEIILAASSVDDVFAITLFTVFLGLGAGSGGSVWWQVGSIPLQVIGGVALGLLLGWLVGELLRVSTTLLRRIEQTALLLALAMVAVLLGERLRVAGLLSVMTLGFVLLERHTNTAVEIERGLDRIWFFAQIMLFVLIGAEVNVTVALQAGLLGLAVVACGLIGRTLGVLIALAGSHLSWRERLFCAIAYLPKATVQAAIGGLPLAAGIGSGVLILATAVLAILVTAPLGALGIELAAPRLLTPASAPGASDA